MSERPPDVDEDPFACSFCGAPIGEHRRIQGHEICRACSEPTSDPARTPVEYDPDPPRVDGDLDGDEEHPLAGQYATEAVESGVLDEDGDVLGHVGLLDLDETTIDEAREIAERVPGTAAVLRSSPRSFHIWGLAVLSLDYWIETADRIEAVDEEHVALSWSRGCQVLRTDAKVAVGPESDGEAVKPEPDLVGIVESDDWTESAPHARLLVDRFDAEIDLDDVDDPDEWVGTSLDERAYLADVGGRSA